MASGGPLAAPLLEGERKRMALLQQQVLALERKLVGMEQLVTQAESKGGLPARGTAGGVSFHNDAESALAARSMAKDESFNGDVEKAFSGAQKELDLTISEEDERLEQQFSTKTVASSRQAKRDSWKMVHFRDDGTSHRKRIRRPDEDFFIDVLSVFEYVVPGWADASIDARGMLDLHGGPGSRMVPLLAILLVIPAYLILPVVRLPSVFRRDAEITVLDRLRCLGRLALMGWFAWSPLLYCLFSTPWANAQRHETTLLTTFFPWWALAWFGYDIANKNLLDACDNAVENMKVQVKNKSNSHAGWFRDILDALASPADPNSHYPMFAISEKDEPVSSPLDLPKHIPVVLLVSVQVMYALYPFFDVSCSFWPTVINLTSAVAIGYAAYGFCYDLGLKMVDFKDCVDEVRVFLFLASPREARASRRRREEYLQLVQENAEARTKLGLTQGDEIISAPSKRHMQKIVKKNTLSQCGELSPLAELPLDVRRLELNLSTVPGVMLFQHLQGWVAADVVNERFGIDTSASILVSMLVTLMGVALVPVFFEHIGAPHVSLTQFVALIDVGAMLIYIGIACSYCVAMNELLFEYSDQVLLMWKDHARTPWETVAKVWMHGEEKRLGPPGDGSPTGTQHPLTGFHGPMEVRALIDITRERLQLQEPQQILGMKVTAALRTKLLSTLAGFLAAAAVSIIKKHLA